MPKTKGKTLEQIKKIWKLFISIVKEYFTRQRYIGFANYYYWKTKTKQKIIVTNRPYAKRHVRWCERTGSELIATFLLDLAVYVQEFKAHETHFILAKKEDSFFPCNSFDVRY